MNFSSSNIKKFLIFSQKKTFLIFLEMESCTFQLKLEKIKKSTPPQKNYLHFLKWNFLALILKSSLYFLIFQEIETLKKASYISGNGTFHSTPKKFLILQETETLKKWKPRKNSLYFRKWKFLIFQQTKLSYISGNGTFLYFEKGIFGTLAYLEL